MRVPAKVSFIGYLYIYSSLFLSLQNCNIQDSQEKYEIKPYVSEYHFTTEKGLDCVRLGNQLDCNWDSWNLMTNYGMYPERALNNNMELLEDAESND